MKAPGPLTRWIVSYKAGALAGVLPVDSTSREASENYVARRLKRLLGLERYELDLLRAERTADYTGMQHWSVQAAPGSEGPWV